MPERSEQRNFQRVKPLRALEGKLGEQKVYVVDVSIHGARIAHQVRFEKTEALMLKFDWSGHTISFECRITRTTIEKYSKDPTKMLYHSGIRFTRPLGESDKTVKEMISGHIVRVLDERRSNAKSVPPQTTTFRRTAAHSSGFLQCRFQNGQWQNIKTQSPVQPDDGFTISAEEPGDQVALLCRSYEEADQNGREMIRKLSSISISQEGGFATRQFEP